MGCFSPGDVVIARVPFAGSHGAKVRPAVVIGVERGNILRVVAVSSRPAGDAPCISISLDDFSSGGLDMFEESYALLSPVHSIPLSRVAGKKGSLSRAFLQELFLRIPMDESPRRK